MLGEIDPLAPGDGIAAAGARRAYWLTVLMGRPESVDVWEIPAASSG